MITWENYENECLKKPLLEKILDIKTICGNSADLNFMEVEISGVSCAVLTIENMLSTMSISQEIFKYLMKFQKDNCDGEEIFNYLTQKSLLSTERNTVYTYGDLLRFAFSGFGVILIDGLEKAVVFGVQGYDKRSISEPTSDVNVKGSKEGFIEVVRTNISLIRRKLKTPRLRFELFQVGELSQTDVAIAFIEGRASHQVVNNIRKSLKKIKLDTILTSSYVSSFLEQGKKSIFSSVYITERPDVFCSKLNEGRVGILIDGTPYALICPCVFSENFYTMDDYASKPFYATYLRILKYICFFITIALPGIYVALATYHPETFSHKLLLNLSASEEATPYPLYVEVFIMMIFYEIMREAGIRLPKAVGGAVSIVGGLIIGDAAVKSGLVSGAILIVIGITATASFVVPNLNEQSTILRLTFILAGGLLGLLGLGVTFSVLIFNLCSMDNFNIPFTAPFTPFFPKALLHSFVRADFKKLEKEHSTIENFNEN